MRTYTTLLFALLMAAVLPLGANAQDGKVHDDFTGAISYSVDAEGSMAAMMKGQMFNEYTLLLGKDRLKQSQKGSVLMGEIDIIVDNIEDMIAVVNHKKKKVTTHKIEEEDDKKDKPKFKKKKGESETILGYETVVYESITKHPSLGSDVITTYYVTEDIKPGMSAEAAERGSNFFNSDLNGFPLKTTTSMMDGAMVIIMTATGVEAKKVSDADFAYPEGYEVAEGKLEEALSGK